MPGAIHPLVERVLFDETAIARRVAELGREISARYRDDEVVVVGVLTGAVTFMADLVRQLQVETCFDFLALSSYGASTESSGVVRVLKDINSSVTGKHVLVVEDIVDTGLTLQHIREHLAQHAPASLSVAVLLDKPERRRIDVPVEYRGFEIPDLFVVGYGIDYAGKFRHLPYVASLKPEAYRG